MQRLYSATTIFAGASVENYLMGAFRGTPNGTSARSEKMRSEGKRLPCMLPRGQQYLDNKIQFIHVDDMARLVRHILQREPETQRLTVLNVAGRGEPLTFGRCVGDRAGEAAAGSRTVGDAAGIEISVDAKDLCDPARSRPLHDPANTLWRLIGCVSFLGPEYEHVMRYTIEEAFADSFRQSATAAASQLRFYLSCLTVCGSPP